jgi:hypothetical protein
MKTLRISISELECNKFGIKKENLAFSDFVNIIRKGLLKQALDRSISLAEK